MSTTRLNKHIALVLGLSRRQADDLIAAGDVVVDGEVAVLGAHLQPGSLVAVQGAPLPEQVTLPYYYAQQASRLRLLAQTTGVTAHYL